MSWRDLLSKRKEARAAKAASAEELKNVVMKIAHKDWEMDSSAKPTMTWEEGSSWYSSGENPSLVSTDGNLDDAFPPFQATERNDKEVGSEPDKALGPSAPANLTPLVTGSSVVLQAEVSGNSTSGRNKRVRSIFEKQFRDGLVDIARLYAKSSSGMAFTNLLNQLRMMQ